MNQYIFRTITVPPQSILIDKVHVYYYDLLLTANGFINQRIFLDSCRNGSSRSLGSQAQISSTKFICYQCSSILTHCTRNYYTIVPSCCVSSSISSITITTTKPLKNASLQKNLFRIKVCSHHQSFHNYTYDLFTFHEMSAFIIFLTKSWGLEKNISYGVCFGFLAQYFFLILNSWQFLFLGLTKPLAFFACCKHKQKHANLTNTRRILAKNSFFIWCKPLKHDYWIIQHNFSVRLTSQSSFIQKGISAEASDERSYVSKNVTKKERKKESNIFICIQKLV